MKVSPGQMFSPALSLCRRHSDTLRRDCKLSRIHHGFCHSAICQRAVSGNRRQQKTVCLRGQPWTGTGQLIRTHVTPISLFLKASKKCTQCFYLWSSAPRRQEQSAVCCSVYGCHLLAIWGTAISSKREY